MSRSSIYSAITLRVKPSGESNREAWFLTAEEGLLKATVFGGPKSKLRSCVAPFHEGKLWIYHDPVRDSRKVTDFDVFFYRMGIREVYERAMTAGAVAETILSFQGGGGNWKEAAQLSSSVLDALDAAGTEACTGIAVYFFWHWAKILGLEPDLSACASCTCEVSRDEALWYSARSSALFCEKCIRRSEFSFRVSPGALRWLREIGSFPQASFGEISSAPDAASLEQAKALSQTVLAAALGKRLPTWEGI